MVGATAENDDKEDDVSESLFADLHIKTPKHLIVSYKLGHHYKCIFPLGKPVFDKIFVHKRT